MQAHHPEDLESLYQLAVDINAYYSQEGQPQDVNKVEEVDKHTIVQMARFGQA